MALSQIRQHKLTEAQRFLRIQIQILLMLISLWFIVKQANKHGKNYKGDGGTNEWTIKDTGVQHNSPLCCPLVMPLLKEIIHHRSWNLGLFPEASVILDQHVRKCFLCQVTYFPHHQLFLSAVGWAMTWHRCSPSKRAPFRLYPLGPDQTICFLFQAYFHWQGCC